MSTNFPGSSNSMDFTAFSHAMGNWRANPCISPIIKYTITCESNGKKVPILWERYEFQFPRFSTYDGFCRIFPGPISQAFPIWWVFLPFPMLSKFDEKTHAFLIWWSIPQDRNLMGKSFNFMEKVWEPIFQVFPIYWISLTLLMLWEIWWETHVLSMQWSMP